MHVEGPFINLAKKGAHDERFIKGSLDDGTNCIKEIYGSLENVAMVTIAPEIDGILDAIPLFLKNNVVVSIGKYFMPIFLICAISHYVICSIPLPVFY